MGLVTGPHLIHSCPFGIDYVLYLLRCSEVLADAIDQLCDIGRDVVPLGGKVIHVVFVLLRKAEVVSSDRRISCEILVD